MNLGRENEKQEFKAGLGQLDKGLKSLSAMLNRGSEGTVFFGVDDDGTVKGLEIHHLSIRYLSCNPVSRLRSVR